MCQCLYYWALVYDMRMKIDVLNIVRCTECVKIVMETVSL